MAGAHGRELAETTKGAHPIGARKLGPCETVEKTMSQRSPSFHINTSPKFHVANIQNILTKGKLDKRGMFVKEIEKIIKTEAIVKVPRWIIQMKSSIRM